MTMTSLPTWVVQLDHADLVDTPDWHDITTDVLDWSTTGPARSRITQKFSAGSASFSLDNESGDFTVSNTLGAHYPLRPNMRIRAGWTWTDSVEGTVTRWEFTGLVDGWPREYAGVNSDTVKITAGDRTKQLKRTELLSPWRTEVTTVAPDAWWRLGESSGTVAVDSSVNGHHGEYLNGATFYSRSGLVVNDADKAIEFPAGTVSSFAYEGPYVLVPPVVDAYPFTVRAIVKTTAARTGAARMIWNAAGIDGESIEFGVLADDFSFGAASGGMVYASISSSTVLRSRFATTTLTNDGEAHVLEWTAESATVWTFTIDGTAQAQDLFASGSPAVPVTTRATIGASAANVFASEADSGAFGGIIDEVMVFTRDLSAGETSSLDDAAMTPWEGDLPGERADRILDAAAVPAADRSLDTGRSEMMAASVSGRSAWDALEQCGDAEGISALYVDGDGKVVLVGRDTIWTDTRWTTSQATFGGLAVMNTAPLAVMYGEDDVATRTVTSRTGGSATVRDDQASQDQYGILDLQKTGLQVLDDRLVEDLANYLLAEFSTPQETVRSLTLAPGDDLTIWAEAVTRRIGDRVTIEPPDGTDSIEATTAGKSWSVDGRKVRLTFTLHRPLAPVWIWDTSTWDTTTRWGF